MLRKFSWLKKDGNKLIKLITTVALAAITITACSPQDTALSAPNTTATESVFKAYVPPVIERIEADKRSLAAKEAEKKAQKAKTEVIKKPVKKSSVEANLIKHMTSRGVPVSTAKTYASIIKSKADKYKVSPYTITAMIQVESNYKPNLVGTHNDTGLMQILPATQRYMKVSGSLFNPDTNIEVGAKYLAYCQKSFGEELGIVAYNQGEGNVKRGTYNTKYLTKVKSVLSTIKR